MTKKEALQQINDTQAYYVKKLKDYIESDKEKYIKSISFKSDTGTGKTNMMALLIDSMQDYFFLITSLSKAELHKQIKANLKKLIPNRTNYFVYGSSDFTKNTKLQAEDILAKLPRNKKCIWLRDEGHIATQNFTKLLESKVYKTIDVSATPTIDNGIKCNFTNTMMLRAVEQSSGTPEDAILKLLEVKEQHKNVPNYNPCAIFRCVKGRNSDENAKEDENIVQMVIDLCNKYQLKYKRVTTGKEVKPLCDNDNEIDVIINKFIITEGVDIRRAHVLYMDNQPGNINTTIQAIGRCRRNALLYRDDIDILDPKNKELLQNTRKCYVIYNVKNMNLEQDDEGELCQSLCNKISCQRLKPEIVSVENGQLDNGLYVEELNNKTGNYQIMTDEYYLKTYGLEFNVVENQDFYTDIIKESPFNHIFYKCRDGIVYVLNADDLDKYAIKEDSDYNWSTCKRTLNGKFIYKLYLLDDSRYRNTFIKKYNIKKYLYDELDDDTYNYRNIMVKLYDKLGRVFNDYNHKPYINLIPSFKRYTYYINDRELAILGCENFRITNDGSWVQSKSMSSKVNISSKFGQFISEKYKDELNYFFNIKHKYKKKHTVISDDKDSYKFKELDTKCNSCLGYCVEYYSKYLVYGESFLREGPFDFIDIALHESHVNKINDGIIIRACILKYKYYMKATFGLNVETVIKSISVDKLIQNSYALFIKKVKLYGKRVAKFISKEMGKIENNIYPVLSTKYIKGLVDYITEDTILDVKTTNGISEGHIRQVLAYHYLSTTRSDLHINRVIVFDAITNKGVIIPISEKNQITRFNKLVNKE